MSDAAFPRIQADPALSATYDALLAALAEIGDFQIRYRKGSVQLVGGGAALALRPHTGGLAVAFGGAPRQAAATSTELILTGPQDVDDALVERIAAAYRTVTPSR